MTSTDNPGPGPSRTVRLTFDQLAERIQQSLAVTSFHIDVGRVKHLGDGTGSAKALQQERYAAGIARDILGDSWPAPDAVEVERPGIPDAAGRPRVTVWAAAGGVMARIEIPADGWRWRDDGTLKLFGGHGRHPDDAVAEFRPRAAFGAAYGTDAVDDLGGRDSDQDDRMELAAARAAMREALAVLRSGGYGPVFSVQSADAILARALDRIAPVDADGS